MGLDHIYFLPNLLSDNFLFPTHATLHPVFFSLIYQVQFVMIIYSWICGLPLECGQLSRGYLKKNRLVLSQKLSISNSSLAMGLHVHSLPTPCWDLVCLEFAQVFCMLSELVRVHMCSCPDVFKR